MNALLIGFGAVAQALCTLKVPFKNITIIDKVDLSELITNFFSDKESLGTNIMNQIKFINVKITKENLNLITQIIGNNKIDIVIDCSYGICTYDLLKILPKNVSYINTMVNNWEDNNNITSCKSLKERQDKIKKWYNKIKPKNNILLDCGMNPGLISLWAYNCCEKMNFDQNEITQCIVSAFDSQRANIPRCEGEFVSTWSPDCFLREIHQPIEGHSLGKYYNNPETTGYKTISISMRFSGQLFYGYTIRHPETITLKKFFPNATLMHIYRCPNEAISSLFEFCIDKSCNTKRILFSEDIIEGSSEIGILMTNGEKLVWYGSLLSNDAIKDYPLSKYINATTYQAACGLWIGIYVLQYYKKSEPQLMTPEDIVKCPLFEYLLEIVNKYLKIQMIEFDNTDTVKKFINNKSFEQHFV